MCSSDLLDIASFGVGNVVWQWALVAAYVPVVVAALVSRGARAAWPTRALLFVVVPLLAQFAHERGVNVVRMPEPLMLAAVTSLGMTLAAALLFAEFLGGRSSTGQALAGVNALTQPAFCPDSKQPELKHAAVKILKAELPWGV